MVFNGLDADGRIQNPTAMLGSEGIYGRRGAKSIVCDFTLSWHQSTPVNDTSGYCKRHSDGRCLSYRLEQ